MTSFEANEAEIRRYFRADRPFDPMHDDFTRLAVLAMLTEIDSLRAELALLEDLIAKQEDAGDG